MQEKRFDKRPFTGHNGVAGDKEAVGSLNNKRGIPYCLDLREVI